MSELKPLVEYPTTYCFKVMGIRGPDFTDHIRQLFKLALAVESSDQAITELPSRQGKYVSLSVSVLLTSEEQRRAIYGSLHKDARVVYYM